ncbi:hypothetical protein AZE42_02018 [Rhizopogon vesiculosus]|uniref:DUF6699 domain-containing protein n=1 Tax=Rhizopogon vesiculosus TaxID=180088 RepID=A0A1J8PNA2_9AGAM|nr:hypothetical protein AZE42_02018 [Rhizopogon vesiculosus]
MFYTARHHTNPPPALHNARYAGCPDPAVQLPHVASPLHRKRTARHVTFDIPSHSSHEDHTTHTQRQPVPQYETHPRTTSATQVSDMDTFGYRRGSTRRTPSLQGAFEIHTGARHDTENAKIKHDPLTRRTKDTVPHGVSKFQSAYLHPLLAPPPLPLVYDLRYPPISLSFPSSSPYADCGSDVLRVPLTPSPPRRIRLISLDFPWAFDIDDVRGPGEAGVTCLEVLSALYAALQRPLTDTEWGSAGEDKHASLLKARDRRLAIIPVDNSRTRTRSTMRFADANQGPTLRDPVVLRVDWLGSRVAFGGLVKDDEFARRRLIPGAKEPPETWVVKFQIL